MATQAQTNVQSLIINILNISQTWSPFAYMPIVYGIPPLFKKKKNSHYLPKERDCLPFPNLSASRVNVKDSLAHLNHA